MLFFSSSRSQFTVNLFQQSSDKIKFSFNFDKKVLHLEDDHETDEETLEKQNKMQVNEISRFFSENFI